MEYNTLSLLKMFHYISLYYIIKNFKDFDLINFNY